MDSLVHDIGDRAQHVVDGAIIAATSGLVRTVTGMAKQGDSPVLAQTEPWEGAYLAPVRVVRDGEAGGWRMWYVSLGPRADGDRALARGTLHVAVSGDGVQWEKRPLGLYRASDGQPTNICVYEDGTPVSGTCAVFDEPEDADPRRRYKMIHYQPNYYLAYSADGLRWRQAQPDPVWPNGSGDGLEETYFFMRDPVINRYRGYMRVWRRHQTIRKVALGESEDLRQWSGPRIIWEAQPHYGIGAQIYGMNVHVDSGVYWGVPWVFYSDEPLDDSLRQSIRLKMAWSRDGVDWQALAPDLDAVAPGPAGAFDSGMLISKCPPVLGDREGLLYYMGCAGRHVAADAHRTRAIGLARWRRGGLVALRSAAEGALLTHRFVLRGNEIRLNARAWGDGEIRGELLDDSGNAIPGFGLRDSDGLRGDSIDEPLAWRGSCDLGRLFGQYLMLKLVLRGAELFSFRVSGPAERFAIPLGPPPVRCGRCRETPRIDGVLSDLCWQDFSNSGVADDFVRFDEMTPAPTRTRLLFTRDDARLYIAVECDEPLSERLPAAGSPDSLSYNRDEVIELRLSAPGHGTHCHQLMVSAGGARQHAWFSKEAGGGRVLTGTEWEARVSAVAGRWCAEMAVPFTTLTAPAPAAGERWRLNVIRYRNMAGAERSCWVCMYGSVHRTDLTGELLFV